MQLSVYPRANLVFWRPCCLAALAGIGVVALAQLDEALDVTAKQRYQSPDGLSVEALGACSVTAEDARCWDLKGAYDSQLRELLVSQLSTGRTVRVPFNGRSRVLMVRHSPKVSYWPSQGRRSYSPIATPKAGTTVEEGIVCSVGEDEKETALDFRFPDPDVPKALTVPLRAGTRILGGGIDLRVESVGRRPEPPPQVRGLVYLGNTNAMSWPITIRGKMQSGRLSVSLAPVDRKGNPIEYVDAKGKPVEVPGPGTRYAGFISWGPWMYSGPGFRSPSADKRYCPVDPRYVAGIRATFSAFRRVRIEGFPLDPSGN